LQYYIAFWNQTLIVTLFPGDIGGSLGLFVGASAISLFELVDLFLFNYAKKKKKEHETKRRQSVVLEPYEKPGMNDQYIKPEVRPAIKA
jgi:formiminotetrahydrofolate cyclodeaminase